MSAESRLRSQSRYLSTFITKWLTQKPDLGNHDWFSIAIHDPRSRPKDVQTLKKAVKFQISVTDGNPERLEYIVSCGVSYLSYRTHSFDLQSFKLFQIIVVQSKNGTFPPLYFERHKQCKRASTQLPSLSFTLSKYISP